MKLTPEQEHQIQHITHRTRPLNHFLSRLEGKLLDVLETNPSAEAPYHNNEHMRTVWQIAQDLWDSEKEDVGLGDPDWSMAVLMFASLLHDYDHSAGKDNDHYNVLRTREFVELLINRHGYSLPRRVIVAIDEAIACTEFPFTTEPKTKVEMVLRDADMLYASMSMDPKLVMEHLRAEIMVAAKRDITYGEMLDGQLKFMAEAKFYTHAGQLAWALYSKRYNRSLEAYAQAKGINNV